MSTQMCSAAASTAFSVIVLVPSVEISLLLVVEVCDHFGHIDMSSINIMVKILHRKHDRQ